MGDVPVEGAQTGTLDFSHARRSPAVVVDLDGTLCDIGARDPYAGHLCLDDRPVPVVVDIVTALADAREWRLVILTGRNEAARTATEAWLERHAISYDCLWMRHPADWRPAPEYKRDIISNRFHRLFDVRIVIDDDPRIAEVCQELGIPFFLVLTTASRGSDPERRDSTPA